MHVASTPVPLDTASLPDVVAAETRALAAVVRDADPTTPVPSCPDWTLTDLVSHVGTIHRWVTDMVVTLSPERKRRARDDRRADGPANAAWLTDGVDPLLAAFAGADPESPMWAWGMPKQVKFWPRRMLHETGVHRADAELAVGQTPSFEPAVAADGIEELLANLPEAVYFAPNVAALVGDGESIVFVALDAKAAWRIDLAPDGFRWERLEGPTLHSTVVVGAPASDLLLYLYGRPGPAPEVHGDADVLHHWVTNSAL